MKPFCFAVCLLLTPLAAQAQTRTEAILNAHVLPRFEILAEATAALAEAAAKDCTVTAVPLRVSYGEAFDAWVAASHLRFGPTEQDDRAFALAFWPDSRGATPRALRTLLAEQDPIATSPETYADVSIAARGFYALEYLLYVFVYVTACYEFYTCTLVQTITADMAMTSDAILAGWTNGYRDQMLTPGPEGIYQTETEVIKALFMALSTGLQFTSESRLGRPLGTFDRPRPHRAEARRSGRSARHVQLSLDALEDLAVRLAAEDPDLQNRLTAQFDDARKRLAALEDPVFADIDDPAARFKLEVVQQSVNAIRDTVAQRLGPQLGVAAGFNSLDGD